MLKMDVWNLGGGLERRNRRKNWETGNDLCTWLPMLKTDSYFGDQLHIQGAQLGALWWFRWDGSSTRKGHMCTYDWVHFTVQQKLKQHWKTTIPWFKNNKNPLGEHYHSYFFWCFFLTYLQFWMSKLTWHNNITSIVVYISIWKICDIEFNRRYHKNTTFWRIPKKSRRDKRKFSNWK